MQFDKLMQDECTSFMSPEDKEFFIYCHEVYEPMLIEKGVLPAGLCERIYGGHTERLCESDPIYKRYYDLQLEIVDYTLHIGKYKYLDEI